MTNVGLVTVSSTPSALAIPCAKVVLPAPRSPERVTMVARSGCGASRFATRAASSCIWAALLTFIFRHGTPRTMRYNGAMATQFNEKKQEERLGELRAREEEQL